MMVKIFGELGISYVAALPYTECREINTALRLRMGFEPRTAILYLVPYYTGETVNISRYAASLDYHLAMREISERVISSLSAELCFTKAARLKAVGLRYSKLNKI